MIYISDCPITIKDIKSYKFYQICIANIEAAVNQQLEYKGIMYMPTFLPIASMYSDDVRIHDKIMIFKYTKYSCIRDKIFLALKKLPQFAA